VAVTAIARELAGFVWAIGQEVAPTTSTRLISLGPYIQRAAKLGQDHGSGSLDGLFVAAHGP
jgi:hypothetical protein